MTAELWTPPTEVVHGGPDNTYRWATITQLSPLRIRLDGDTVALPTTPDSLCDPGLFRVGSRVWVQIFGRRLIVLGVANGGALTGSEITRRVAGANRTSSTSNATSIYNVVSVTIPYPINGRRYRATGTVDVTPDTAGAFSSVQIQHGVNAVVGGTVMASKYLDHRIVARTVGMTLFGEFAYSGPDGDTPYNVVLCVAPQSGTGSLATCAATRPATLVVDELL